MKFSEPVLGDENRDKSESHRFLGDERIMRIPPGTTESLYRDHHRTCQGPALVRGTAVGHHCFRRSVYSALVESHIRYMLPL